MKNQLSKEKQEESVLLKEQLEIIILFHIEKEYDGFDYAYDMLQHTFKIGALTAIRESFNDMVEISMELPPNQLTELNRRLKEKFGKNLFDMNDKLEKKINSIIKRKKVRNNEEFRMIAAFLDTIRDVDGKEDDVNVLEELNFDYEESLSKK